MTKHEVDAVSEVELEEAQGGGLMLIPIVDFLPGDRDPRSRGGDDGFAVTSDPGAGVVVSG